MSEVDIEERSRRLPLLNTAALSHDQRRLYEQMQETMLPWAKSSGFKAEAEDGKLLGPFNAFLYSPEIGAASLRYLQTEHNATEVDDRVREVVILTVGAVFRSEYELYAHRAVAAKAGMVEPDIEALAAGRDPGPESQLHNEERVAQRFVKAVSAEHRVSPELYAEALKAFGHRALVDMLHLAGIYMTVSSILNAFEVPVPE